MTTAPTTMQARNGPKEERRMNPAATMQSEGTMRWGYHPRAGRAA
jgi:hypothetical protein